MITYGSLCYLQTRQMHGVDVEGAIVILDEAHNIVSQYSADTILEHNPSLQQFRRGCVKTLRPST